jgi:hypothetical protein
VNEIGGHVTRIRVYKVLVGKSEGKRPLGRRRRRWEDSVIMDIKIGLEGVDWIQLAQNRDRWQVLMNTVVNLRVS